MIDLSSQGKRKASTTTIEVKKEEYSMTKLTSQWSCCFRYVSLILCYLNSEGVVWTEGEMWEAARKIELLLYSIVDDDH